MAKLAKSGKLTKLDFCQLAKSRKLTKLDFCQFRMESVQGNKNLLDFCLHVCVPSTRLLVAILKFSLLNLANNIEILKILNIEHMGKEFPNLYSYSFSVSTKLVIDVPCETSHKSCFFEFSNIQMYYQKDWNLTLWPRWKWKIQILWNLVTVERNKQKMGPLG